MVSRKDKWESLSIDEQETHRFQRQFDKKLARSFEEISEELRTSEQQLFINEHLPIPGSVRRRLKNEKRSTRRKASTLQYTTKSDEVLSELHQLISSSRNIVCIDVEQHEYSKKITEVGVSTYYHETREIKTNHYIIEEYYHHRNRKRVPDNKDNFNHGTSKKISINDLRDVLNLHTNNACFIAGHAFSNDTKMLGEILDINGTKILDTQYFAKYYFKENKTFGLETLLKTFKIFYECLHNAGNDAYYTLQCLLAMQHQKELV